MPELRGSAGALQWTIAAACGMFIAILCLSAWWDPSIRWLHFFQAWLYGATALLVMRQSRWGYFLGMATAGFWDYATLFLNNFFHAGREQLMILLGSGELPRPDLLIAVPAVAANLVIIAGSIAGYLRLPRRGKGDLLRFAASIAASVGYFAAIMWLFQPRYLVLFSRVLHPHLSL